MEILNKANTYAVIVAIEDYRFDINKVKYAKRDAEAFRDLLISDFNVPKDNIDIWVGQNANKTALEQELPYKIRQTTPDDLFIFYYAGHGFSDRGLNRLTTWDTHPDNLTGTSVLLKDILLDPINNNALRKCLIFIDACSTDITDGFSRDMLSQMNNKEFENFIHIENFQATFLSCSPGQKSYSSDTLQHGIWTWHLLNALKGNAAEAIVRDKFITNASLQDYLRNAVPDYIQKNTEIKGNQVPYSVINSSHTFQIRELEQKDLTWDSPLNSISLDFERTFYRTIETLEIKRLPGFSKSKGHFIPEHISELTSDFIGKLLKSQTEDELDEIYENSKKILKLKRKNIQKASDDRGGNVDTPFYRYYLNVMQNPSEPTEAMIVREIHIRVDLKILPEDFDYIFPFKLNELVIPISNQLDFDTIVDQFEDLAEQKDGEVIDDERNSKITFIFPNKTKFEIDTYSNEVSIKPFRPGGLIGELIDHAHESLTSVKSLKQIETPE